MTTRKRVKQASKSVDLFGQYEASPVYTLKHLLR